MIVLSSLFPASTFLHPGSIVFSVRSYLVLAVQQSIDPVLEQLDPPRRAAVVMALLGLTLVGLFLITTVLVGGHWVRRLARHRPAGSRHSARARTISELQDSLEMMLPDMKKGDTVLLDTRSKDTKVDH